MTDKLYIWLKEKPALHAVASLLRGKQVIALDYPIHPKSRYGFGHAPHPQLHARIAARRNQYREQLNSILALEKQLKDIPRQWWNNPYLPGLDAVTLYGYAATRKPQRYVEVGSGMSTRFARQAITNNQTSTVVTSIDPHPRADIDSLCDHVIRQSLERVDLALFQELRKGDLLFVDNSHQSFQNSDVTVFFLDILPNLKPDVLVGIHDILLPDDYPPTYVHNYYNEQYLLAAYLLGGGQGIEIILPNWFASQDSELNKITQPLFSHPNFKGVDTHGSIFWFKTI